MPILDIELVGSLPEASRAGLAQRIADAAGLALGARPQGTWVRLRAIATEDYAESGGTPPGVTPVFVSVLRAELPDRADLESLALRLAQVVAEACGRSAENVHVLFEPPAAGRIAFGGRLRS